MDDPLPGAPSAARLYRLAFLNFFGWYLMTPILPLYLATLTTSPALIGAVIASASILPLILAYPLGILADRLPARTLGMTGTAGMAAAAAGLVMWQSIMTAAMFQMLYGISQVTIVLTIQTALSRTGGASFETLYGRYTFWASAGQTVSPLLAGLSANWLLAGGAPPGQAYRAVFAGTALVFVVALAAVLRLPQQQSEARRHPAFQVRSTSQVLRAKGMVLALAASAVLVFAFDVRRSFYPLYLRELGLSPVLIGALFSIFAASSGLVRPLLGRVSCLVGPSYLLRCILIAGALGWAGVAQASSWPTLATLAVVCGVTQGLGHPLTMSMVAGMASPGMVGSSLGIRQVFNQTGQFLSPLALGLTVSYAGSSASAFVAAAAALALVAAVVGLASSPDRAQ